MCPMPFHAFGEERVLRAPLTLSKQSQVVTKEKQCEHMDGGTLQNRLPQVHLALRAEGVFCRALMSVAVPGNNGMILLTSVRALSKGRPMFGESLVSFFRTELTPPHPAYWSATSRPGH